MSRQQVVWVGLVEVRGNRGTRIEGRRVSHSGNSRARRMNFHIERDWLRLPFCSNLSQSSFAESIGGDGTQYSSLSRTLYLRLKEAIESGLFTM